MRNGNGKHHGTSEPRRPRVPLVPITEMTETGTIKWFDENRNYGFVVDDLTGRDVFVHASTIRQYGLSIRELIKGVAVRFKSEHKPGKRDEVLAIAMA